MSGLKEQDFLAYYTAIACGLVQRGSDGSIAPVTSTSTPAESTRQTPAPGTVESMQGSSKGKKGERKGKKVADSAETVEGEGAANKVQADDVEAGQKKGLGKGKKKIIESDPPAVPNPTSEVPVQGQIKQPKKSKKAKDKEATIAVAESTDIASQAPTPVLSAYEALAKEISDRAKERSGDNSEAGPVQTPDVATKQPAKPKPRKSKTAPAPTPTGVKGAQVSQPPTPTMPKSPFNPATSSKTSTKTKATKTPKSTSRANSVAPVASPAVGTRASAVSSTPARGVPSRDTRAPSTPVSEADVYRYHFSHVTGSGSSRDSPASQASASPATPASPTQSSKKRKSDALGTETPLRQKVLSRPLSSLNKKRKSLDLAEREDLEEVDELATPVASPAPISEKKKKKKSRKSIAEPVAPSSAPVATTSTASPIASASPPEERDVPKPASKSKKNWQSKRERPQRRRRRRRGESQKIKRPLHLNPPRPLLLPQILRPPLPPSIDAPTTPASKKRRRLTDLPIPRLTPAKSPAVATSAENGSPSAVKKPRKSVPTTPFGQGQPEPAVMHMYAAMGVVTPSPKAKASAGSGKKEKKRLGPRWVTETPKQA
ncbi:hypothetical protein IAR50_001810 [Cryptococcus sp. DSM 104548]